MGLGLPTGTLGPCERQGTKLHRRDRVEHGLGHTEVQTPALCGQPGLPTWKTMVYPQAAARDMASIVVKCKGQP